MSVRTTPELAKFMDMASKLEPEDITEVVVATLLAWKARHPEADAMSDVVVNIIRAMVIDAGGEVYVRELDDDEYGEEWFDEWFDDEDD